jgi:thymidylate synthase (FAD)
MNVSLVSITHPRLDTIRSAEDLIVYCGRVSNPNNQLNFDSAPKLLKYLIKHKHWSPFEMVDMTVEIKTSRAIAAQILRHRSFSFQEFSQRYSVVTDIEPVQLRKQAKNNRQSSEDDIVDSKLHDIVDCQINSALKAYNDLLEAGAAREVARMILPLTVQTTLYMKGSIRSWVHYLQLRLAQATQKEHREVAEAIDNLFKTYFPIITEAMELAEKEAKEEAEAKVNPQLQSKLP